MQLLLMDYTKPFIGTNKMLILCLDEEYVFLFMSVYRLNGFSLLNSGSHKFVSYVSSEIQVLSFCLHFSW